MAQWVNRLRNNIFVNAPPLPLLCEISGDLHLAQPGPTAGWPSVRPAGRLSDEIQVNFEIFKVGCRSKYSGLYTTNKESHLLRFHEKV